MNAKQKLVSAKNKIVKNKTKILAHALVFTTTVAVVSQIGRIQMDNFLKEKDLYDEYYTPDAD